MVAPLSPLRRGRATGDESFYIPLCRRIKNVIPSQKAHCSSMTFLLLCRTGGFYENRRIGPGWPACPAFGKSVCLRRRKLCIVRFRACAEALSRRCSSSPHATFGCAGARWRQPPFPPAASQRYNTLDLASKIVCHETAGFFGFFRPHRPQAACNAQPLNAAFSALQRERRPLWIPLPTGMLLAPIGRPRAKEAHRPSGLPAFLQPGGLARLLPHGLRLQK